MNVLIEIEDRNFERVYTNPIQICKLAVLNGELFVSLGGNKMLKVNCGGQTAFEVIERIDRYLSNLCNRR